MTAATATGPQLATSDTGSDCVNGWTKVTGLTQCDPPTALTDSIGCSATALSVKIKPSHVFDDYTRIPSTVLETLKVKIAGSSGAYQDFFTFGTTDAETQGTISWGDLDPYLHTEADKIYMSYKLKVDDPSITFGTSSIYTTRHVNAFYVRCMIAKQVQVKSSSLTMETINLGAATNGTASNEIDSSSIFSLGTYTDTTYATTSGTFNIGEDVFAKVAGAGMATMPAALNWVVNECLAKGDTDAQSMAIFQSAGECINPYLDVSTSAATDTDQGFSFKAFTFDSNNVDDSIEITCSIKLGQGSDQYSDSGTECVLPMISAPSED